MSRIFSYINMAEKQKAKKHPAYTPKKFDPSKDEDIEQYLTQYLPARIAKNFGKLHNLDLIHVFPHSGNISAAGGMYDLDSMRGEPLGLGDNPVTEEDKKNDALCLLSASRVLSQLKDKGLISTQVDLFESFGTNFDAEYSKQRIKHTLTKKTVIWDYIEYYDYFDENDRKQVTKDIAHLLSEGTGWEFENENEILRITEKFLEKNFDEALTNLQIVFDQNPHDKDFYSIFRKHGQLHNENEANIKRSETLENIILEDIEQNKTNELTELRLNYGEKIATAIMFIEQKTKYHAVQEQTSNNHINNRSFRFIAGNIIEKLGWEKDIAPHTPEIMNIFGGFTDKEDREYFDHYFEILSRQVGLTIKYSEPVNELLEKFHEYDKASIKETITQELQQNPHANIEEIIKNLQEETTENALFDFLIARIEDVMRENYHEQITELYKKYPDDQVGMIGGWYLLNAINQTLDTISEENMAKLGKKRDQMLKETGEQFKTKQ
jgi:hypothetical protein